MKNLESLKKSSIGTLYRSTKAHTLADAPPDEKITEEVRNDELGNFFQAMQNVGISRDEKRRNYNDKEVIFHLEILPQYRRSAIPEKGDLAA